MRCSVSFCDVQHISAAPAGLDHRIDALLADCITWLPSECRVLVTAQGHIRGCQPSGDRNVRRYDGQRFVRGHDEQRQAGRRNGGAPAVKYTWRTSQYRGMTESECEVVEKELAERECGRNLRFKPLTRPLTYKVRKDGTEVARLSCPFDLECACPWKLRRIRHSTSNGYRYDLEFADHAHADHHSRTSSAHGQRHQLSKRIKGLIDSPTKLLAKPRQLVQALRSQANVTAQDVPLIVAERFRLLQ